MVWRAGASQKLDARGACHGYWTAVSRISEYGGRKGSAGQRVDGFGPTTHPKEVGPRRGAVAGRFGWACAAALALHHERSNCRSETVWRALNAVDSFAMRYLASLASNWALVHRSGWQRMEP
jgi:hypothetical protein